MVSFIILKLSYNWTCSKNCRFLRLYYYYYYYYYYISRWTSFIGNTYSCRTNQ